MIFQSFLCPFAEWLLKDFSWGNLFQEWFLGGSSGGAHLGKKSPLCSIFSKFWMIFRPVFSRLLSDFSGMGEGLTNFCFWSEWVTFEWLLSEGGSSQKNLSQNNWISKRSLLMHSCHVSVHIVQISSLWGAIRRDSFGLLPSRQLNKEGPKPKRAL